MATEQLNLHTSAEITLTLQDADGNPAPAPVNEITVWIIKPDGTGADTAYTDTTLTQVGSSNVYKLIYPNLDQSGRWRVVARSSGTVDAASEDFIFDVNTSRVA